MSVPENFPTNFFNVPFSDKSGKDFLILRLKCHGDMDISLGRLISLAFGGCWLAWTSLSCCPCLSFLVDQGDSPTLAC